MKFRKGMTYNRCPNCQIMFKQEGNGNYKTFCTTLCRRRLRRAQFKQAYGLSEYQYLKIIKGGTEWFGNTGVTMVAENK